ncbi:MAG: UbiX family flavin prenyltransferase [Magnetococcales bacterium]|nr:UbiX family flavin prenyltransferase [Magnetococcales bacterium]
MQSDRPVAVAWTGASGARYGLRLLGSLLSLQQRVDLLISDAARLVLRQECGLDVQGDGAAVVQALAEPLGRELGRGGEVAGLRHFAQSDWMAPLASGASGARAMVVCPCSMGTLAAIAHGLSDTLIERAADVMIKERRPLVLVPREAPLSAIHLENMLSLTRLGVTILPAAPGFYHRPATVEALLDFMVARILDQLGVVHRLLPSWPPASDAG